MILTGCNVKTVKTGYNERYLDMIETLNARNSFANLSDHFDISTDIASTNNGYRYYVFVDNPRVAMYGIEIIAIEKGKDYKTNMAANVGILDDSDYSMIPGQVNIDKGYVAGLSISGTTDVPNPTLYVMVNWHGINQDIIQEFFVLNVDLEEINE